MADILGISGSPRRGGNSDALVQTILAGAAETGTSTKAFALRDIQFSSCVGCERCRKDKACTRFIDGMNVVYPEFEAARGLVLVSPAHNYNITALMKAFIDRLYCYYDFTDDRPRVFSSRLAGQGRQAVVVGIGEQPEHENAMGMTIEMQTKPLEALGYGIVDTLTVYSVFDAGGVKRLEETMAAAHRMGRSLAEHLP